jgi:hypothetical protein
MTLQLVNKYHPHGGESFHHVQGQPRSVTTDNLEKEATTLF